MAPSPATLKECRGSHGSGTLSPDAEEHQRRWAAIRARYEAQLVALQEQNARLKAQQDLSAELLAEAHERIIRRWIRAGEDHSIQAKATGLPRELAPLQGTNG
jgi:hypothetical protein